MRINGVNSTRIGVVGLGLMGSSIVVSLLAAGHQVIALAPIPGEKDKASRHIADLLRHADASGVLRRGISSCIDALWLVEDYAKLTTCELVVECVIEDRKIKEKVYHQIAEAVGSKAVIASNTSAIPISELQALVPSPERFLGIHWAEPAYMTKFLEVTCGRQTDLALAEYVMSLGVAWGKEPTLLKKDIRGFITNRLMYAVYRESLTLIENGYISMEDADKVLRYDAGSWVTFMGIFERMCLLGLEDHIKAFEAIFSKLSNREDVPAIMQEIVNAGSRGIHNLKGLYLYNEESAKAWETAFAQFNKDIYDLGSKYQTKAKGLEEVKEEQVS